MMKNKGSVKLPGKGIPVNKWPILARKIISTEIAPMPLYAGTPQGINRDVTCSDEAQDLGVFWTAVYMGMNGMVAPKMSNKAERDHDRIKTKQSTLAIIASLKAMSAPEVKVSSSVCSGVQDSIERCINSLGRDRVGMARALRAGVDLVASLRQANPLYGNYLLQLMRTWNGLGAVEDPKLDEAREIALLRYVGVDDEYVAKYEDIRSWALNHPDDKDSGWEFYRAAMPLMEAFAGDRRIDEAARVCRDIYDIAGTNQKGSEAKHDMPEVVGHAKQFHPVEVKLVGGTKLSIGTAERSLHRLLKLVGKAIEAGHVDLESALKLPAVLCGDAAREEARKQRPLILEYLRVVTILASIERSDLLKSVETLMKEAVEPQPLPLPMQTDFSWRIANVLKGYLPTARGNNAPKEIFRVRSAAKILCNLYLQLVGVEKPSPLHSLMLRRACGVLGEQELIEFITAWDLKLLREEDYEPWHPQEGKRVDSLVEVLIPAIYRALKRMRVVVSHWKALGKENPEAAARHEELREACLRAIEFVGTHYQRYPAKPIYHYYYARTLTWTSQRDKARQELLSKATGYSSAWWFWSALADTCGHAEDEDRLAFLCKARVTASEKDEAYLKGLKKQIESLLGEMKLPLDGETIRKYAARAERLVAVDCKRFEGVILTVGEEGHSRSIQALIRHGGSVKLAIGVVSELPVEKLVRGTPVYVDATVNGTEHRIIHIEPRESDPWDVLPLEDAIVIRHNQSRSSRTIFLQDGASFNLTEKSWVESAKWTVGTSLKLKLLRGKDVPHIVEANVSHELPEIARKVEGSVDRVQADGAVWLDSGVHIRRQLAVPKGLSPGLKVSVIAVPYGKSADQWEAIALT